MTTVPKKYQFTNPMPSFEPRPLPATRPEASVGQQPMQLPEQPQQYAQPQVVHVHHAAPDRTVQRLALGAGMGAGMVAAGVYFGPLLVTSMVYMGIVAGVGGLVIAVIAVSIVSVIRTIKPEPTTRKRRR